MREITPAEGQRVDNRALYAPLREYRDTYTVPLARDDVSTSVHINTAGMSPAECCTEIGAEPIVRWNEAPDYPRGTSPGWTVLGLLILSVSAVLSIAAFVHLAGWLGWLS